jgi:hypothetical protein
MNELVVRAALWVKFNMGATACEDTEFCTLADCSVSLARPDKTRIMLASNVVLFLQLFLTVATLPLALTLPPRHITCLYSYHDCP